MIRSHDLRVYVVRPTLEKMDMWSESAEELLMGTAAVESDLGYFLKQVRGPARGIYQMEPATETDIWDNYILFRPELMAIMTSVGHPLMPDDDSMIFNLEYATAMCRLHYRRVPTALPRFDDLKGLERYHKVHYNTHKGKTEEGEFRAKYKRLVSA